MRSTDTAGLPAAAAAAARESFQPISVKSPADHPLRFRLRCVVDLQLATIAARLRPALAGLRGDVLDVGAGESPWRGWLPAGTRYRGIDVGHADEFGMRADAGDVVYYDGRLMPFDDARYDAALCIEVLEHAADPRLLLAEIARVLKPGATLLLTVPWSARRHHIPHDYHRFTRERLAQLFAEAGFVDVRIDERGSDIGVIANKLVVLTLRLLRPARLRELPWSLPLGLASSLPAAAFVVAAHCAEALGRGAKEDPLGYFVQARKAAPADAAAVVAPAPPSTDLPA